MDNRWLPSPKNTTRNGVILFHPTAAMRDVWNGTATDGINVSANVSACTQSTGQVTLTVDWNTEFLGNNQPRTGWILEIQEDGNTLWLGIVENINSYVVAFGQRQMQITARSRENFDIWKLTSLVTQLYPQLTNLSTIVSDIAGQVGLWDDEVILPPSSITTQHMNTQLASTPAWEMVNTIMLPMGLTPMIDCLGRLRGISRQIKGRTPDIILTPDRVVKVNATRMRPPTTRVIVQWLDPNLSKVTQLPRKLAEHTMTMGFFTPYLRKHLWFSADNTQRAENTYMIIRQSANALYIPVCLENYSQTSETEGLIELISLGYTQAIIATTLLVGSTGYMGDLAPPTGGLTAKIGTKIHAHADQIMFLTLMSMGTGIYELWGTPYDFVHVRNTSEAFDQNAAPWLDNPQTISSDLVMNEAHAQDIAIRELVYLSAKASSWSATIVEDRRIEKGDILQFPDGSLMYIEDYTRKVQRGAENTLEVRGFVIG